MENPRPEKVAVVEDVEQRLRDAQALLVSEYRGLSVAELAQLRSQLRAAGTEYRVYKNTLVRIAAGKVGVEIDEFLVGPTAIAFVGPQGENGGDPVLAAKALASFAKANPNLVLKGGVLGDTVLSAAEAEALAKVAPREELLARFAGGLAAPMRTFAGLLEALPRNFAYALQALIEKGGAVESPAADSEDAAEASATEAGPEATTESNTEPAPAVATESETPDTNESEED